MSRYPQYDRSFNGYRLFIGNIGERVGKYDLETEFDRFGPLIDIWVARNPPGFAYVVYKQKADAEEAVRSLHGRRVCGKRIRVEFARPYPGPAPKISYVPRQRNRRAESTESQRLTLSFDSSCSNVTAVRSSLYQTETNYCIGRGLAHLAEGYAPDQERDCHVRIFPTIGPTIGKEEEVQVLQSVFIDPGHFIDPRYLIDPQGSTISHLKERDVHHVQLHLFQTLACN
ncbi:putative serine/arginine-rich splicing factor 7 isoform X1 [Apostichopus japonicus]|uniref:Putative serine/arginine-rich splicing factor 7 isoform X1 n=1 Tax=Stichopus japonicus TaxID=307972 RepID=A0A2G8L7U4_STIJA|nr:putative serine/arginine-rich splicing factor 7 isoform X1 [Apostichopus japonicus]